MAVFLSASCFYALCLWSILLMLLLMLIPPTDWFSSDYLLYIMGCGISFASHHFTTHPRYPHWDEHERGPSPQVYKGWGDRAATINLISDKTRKKLIVMWTNFYFERRLPHILPVNLSLCPVNNCDFTLDRQDYSHADALLFHYHVFDLSPRDLPLTRSPHQRYIVYIQEPPTVTAMVPYADFNNYFNWTVSYRTDSDIYGPYYDMKAFVQRQQRNEKPRNYASGKTRLMAIFTSRWWLLQSERGRVVRMLKRYLPVDVYSGGKDWLGTAGKLRCDGRWSFNHSDTCAAMLGTTYKFYLAFENSLCRDYITEKFYRALTNDVVPIVLGGAAYSSVVPQSAYISVRDFASIHDLVDYIIEVDKNDTLYNQYFYWKQEPRNLFYPPEQVTSWMCDMCAKLNDPREPYKTLGDMGQWWDQCIQPQWR